jgi:hypothetical protein
MPRVAFNDMVSDVRAESIAAPRPLWAVELGVELPCDVPTVHRAFRHLAKRTHPDCAGGSHQAFLEAQRVLREALAAVHDTVTPFEPSRPWVQTRAASSSPLYA